MERGAERRRVPERRLRRGGRRARGSGRGGLGSEIVVRVAPPTAEEVEALASGTVLIGFLQPSPTRTGSPRLRERDVVAFAMESIRASRARSRWTRSPSQATVGGYKAVLLAADWVPKLFPMLMTAAGTIAPVRALVIGAGVAGLQAIATARRLGAVVSAFDVRLAVKEQVESLGAAVPELGVRTDWRVGTRPSHTEQQAQQQAALEERIPEFDVVITTAAIPGRPAPTLIPTSAVEKMRPRLGDRRPGRGERGQLRADRGGRGRRARRSHRGRHDEPLDGVPREPALLEERRRAAPAPGPRGRARARLGGRDHGGRVRDETREFA